MRIAFDAQPLVNNDKTGVAWNQLMLTRTIMELYPKHFQYFFLHFNFRHNKIPLNLKEIQFSQNCTIKVNKYIPYGIYRRLWNMIPFDYDKFFNVEADIYHFFNFICPPKVNGKIALTVHDMVHKTFPKTMQRANFRRLEKDLARSCNQADIIIAVSENTKKEISNYLHIDPLKIYVIYNGVDLNRFHPNYTSNELSIVKRKYKLPKKYLLYLGTLEPRKNIDLIIDAYNKLIKGTKCSDMPYLVIAGKKGWLYKDLFNKVAKYKLQQKIIFPGYIEDKDVPLVMSGALSFIFPSLYEGFGMPPLEAMACGVPVITSNTSSLPEVVGDAALLVNPYSVEELFISMLEIINNYHLRNDLIEKGLIRAKNFSWEKSAIKTINIYKKLLME